MRNGAVVFVSGLVACALGPLLALSCGRHERRLEDLVSPSATLAPLPSGVGGGAGALELHANLIAGERCARESRCAAAGFRVRYATRQSCLDSEITRERHRLGASPACVAGVAQHRIDDCQRAMRAAPCPDPLDPAPVEPECAVTNLCRP